MKKRVLSIKHRKQKEINWVAVVLALGLIAVTVLTILTPKQETNITIDEVIVTPDKPEQIETTQTVLMEVTVPEKTVEAIEPPSSPSGKRVREVYESVGSPIADKAEWVAVQAELRGLNPFLVLAVMAQESGWGKHCPRANCFGWGFTDSGDMGIGDGSFESTTLHILDRLAEYYAVQSAEEMHQRGYNFNDSWVVAVTSIQGMF